MEVRHTWLFKLAEQQKTHSTQRNGEFLRQVRERQSRRHARSSRLLIASCAASLAWFFAMLQGLLKS